MTLKLLRAMKYLYRRRAGLGTWLSASCKLNQSLTLKEGTSTDAVTVECDFVFCAQKCAYVNWFGQTLAEDTFLKDIHIDTITCRVVRVTRMTGSSMDDWIY
jgi:hypothetical protein